MGDGVPSIDDNGLSNNEIEDILLRRCGYKLGFSRGELTALVAHDPCYLKIKARLMKALEERKPEREAMDLCKKEAVFAFRRWQRMRNFNGVKRERVRQLKSRLLRRMSRQADVVAARSILKIQLVLGVPKLDERKIVGRLYPNRRSERLSSRLEAIRGSLQEPWDVALSPPQDGQPKTQS